MPAEGTNKIPHWMTKKIKQIAWDWERGNGKRPTWQTVSSLLQSWMELTPASYGSKKSLYDEYKDYMPRRASITARMREARKITIVDDPIEDAPWTFSMSSRYGFADEASGELFLLWKYSIGFLDAAPFTVRIARWANRLRFIAEAGGSRSGHVVNEVTLLELAAAYAAREKAAVEVTEGRGQTGILGDTFDSELMFRDQPAVLKLAKELGAFKGIGPQNWIVELNNDNPIIARELEQRLDAIVLRLREISSLSVFSDVMRDRVLALENPHHDNEAIIQMMNRLNWLGMQKFQRVMNSRTEFKGLKEGQTYTNVIQANLMDIVQTIERDMKEGTNTIDAWEPKIEQLLNLYYAR